MLVRVEQGVVTEYPIQPGSQYGVIPPAWQGTPAEFFQLYNLYIVEYAAPPEHDPSTHKAVEVNPTLVDGKWTSAYEIQPLVGDEATVARLNKVIEVVNHRNTLLAESDWTQVKDIPEYISVQYSEYRQALRDITEQPGYPWNVEWPAVPR